MKTENAENACPLDEAALIAAAQQDPGAFGPLYERYVNSLYRYAYRRVGNHAEAEDVTAQTFQHALSALPAFEWRGAPFGAWLHRIAANILIRRQRSARREITVEDVTTYIADERQEENDPALIVVQDDAENELLTALRQLPLDQQRAIVLRFSHGLKSREIGEALGRSEGAAKQLLYRALQSLRASLEHMAHD